MEMKKALQSCERGRDTRVSVCHVMGLQPA